MGWGFIVRSSDDQHLPKEGVLGAASWTETEAKEPQVHQEARGCCLAMEAASKLTNTHNAIVIFRNDCVPVLASFRKGTFQSLALQSFSVQMTLHCASQNSEMLLLHAPGKTLIEEGVDNASR